MSWAIHQLYLLLLLTKMKQTKKIISTGKKKVGLN